MELTQSRATVVDLQQSRIKRLRHRSRHTQTFWTHPKTWLVTLTYAPHHEVQKEHWTEALTRFRKWYTKTHGGVAKVLWVREMTKRGKLHYHAVINGEYPGKWDRLGFWPYGMSRVDKGQGDTCTAYLMKYASKLDSKLSHQFKHWRLYGFVGLRQDERKTISYQMLPEWIRNTYQPEAVQSACRRVLVTGQRLYSGWIRGGFRGLPKGFDSMTFVGYCSLAASIHYQHGMGAGAKHRPAVGLVT